MNKVRVSLIQSMRRNISLGWTGIAVVVPEKSMAGLLVKNESIANHKCKISYNIELELKEVAHRQVSGGVGNHSHHR